ncbi:MAG: dihydroxyacetone kinase subunit L [Candidatus Atribacteria bacterium]|nr:dihydroxyacetone kinase subunit L [Candidatus Atribacteria bacterium]
MNIILHQEDIKNIIVKLDDVFKKEKDFLNELDSKIGDGDHGLTMYRGTNAIAQYLEEYPDLKISDILIKGGFRVNEITGSTIGILIFSAMKAAGLAIKEKESINIKDIQKMLQDSIQAIEKRGKASKGQKTILDSLIPALESLEENNDETDDISTIKRMIKNAYDGAESTKNLESQIGRAKWFKNRSMGVMDPGAYTGYLILKTIGDYILKNQ